MSNSRSTLTVLLRALAACTAAAIHPQRVRGLAVKVKLCAGDYGDEEWFLLMETCLKQAELRWQTLPLSFSSWLREMGYIQASLVHLTFDVSLIY